MSERIMAYYCPKCQKGYYQKEEEQNRCAACSSVLIPLKYTKEAFSQLTPEAKQQIKDNAQKNYEKGIYLPITVTDVFEGETISEYLGLVFGEVIEGTNFMTDLSMSFTDIFGGRNSSFEENIIQTRQAAIDEMCNRARKKGADGIVGVRVDYETIGSVLMITASGSAVKLKKKED